MPALSERARGRWAGILPQLGVPARFLNGKHQPCPVCGGKDRARFDDKDGRGTFICNRCGAGSGIDLVMRVNGWDFREAAEHIEAVIDEAPLRQPRPGRGEGEQRAALNRLWTSSRPVQEGDPVSLWLGARVGLAQVPPCLRYAPELRYQAEMPSCHPGMVAMVQDAAGRPATLHRTYLTAAGGKAPLAKPRMLMPGPVPDGAAVRLFEPGRVLGIAEGIETAFAAAALFSIPCWAALNSALLQKWVPPAEAREIVIFGDNDPGFGGQAAAFALAHRLSGNTNYPREVRVEIPDRPGDDWNDVLSRESDFRTSFFEPGPNPPPPPSGR